MKVLITGSGGMIGTALVERLAASGYDVRTFDRRAASRGAVHEHLPGDLRDLDVVRRAVSGVDAIAHLGALSHDRAGSPDEVLDVNVRGTWNVLLAAVEAGIGRVVAFSSVNALGHFGGRKPPVRFPIDDSYPRHPRSPYQLSKHLAEEAGRSFTERYGLVTVFLRPAFVASPDQYRGWTEHGDERRAEWGRRDFWAYVDLRDVCAATELALRAEGIDHGAYLLTADDTTMATPTSDLVDRFYDSVPWPGEARDAYLSGRPNRSLVDCTAATGALGWRPAHSWRDDAV